MKQEQQRTRLKVLGGWRLEIDGRPTSGPGYRKGRGLLAYLALEDGWHSREKLGELFAVRSAGHLRQILSNLRTTLDLPESPPSILSEHNLLRLNPDYPIWRDSAAFMEAPEINPAVAGAEYAAHIPRLEQCIELYLGEFLHGLSLADCPGFEEWLETRREQLRQRALSLLDRLRQCCESVGDRDRALTHARRTLELDPWNEAGHRHVMRLLALEGRGMAALAQYESCRRMLEKELGIGPEAETRALHASICSGELAASATPPASPATATAAAERRLVTILVCKLSVPGDEDIDRIAEALAQPRQRCQAIIAAQAGHRIVSHGSRLLAYFGYPLARENAARHAVRAALAIRGEITGPVQVRLGIHTGMVVTHPQSGDPDTAGVASGWAIRLAQAAAPGSLLVSAPTRSLVDGYVQFQPMGQLAGQDEKTPMPVFRVENATGLKSRLDCAASLSPLVGREQQLNELLTLWREARQGAHPSILIRGDAGIGKSRLVHSLCERLDLPRGAILELRCFPEFSNSAFHPVLVLLTTLFGFTTRDTAQEKLGRIAAFLQAGLPAITSVAQEDVLPLLAQALHLPAQQGAQDIDSTPLRLKEKTCSLLLELLHGLAQDHPLLLIVEDLHWCDPSTLDLLARHVRLVRAEPILTVLTARPDCRWEDADTVLDLPPLDGTEVAELVAGLDPDLPAAAVQRIVAWSDGIPLFAEEMARIGAHAETLSRGPATPLTLQELLAARLDSAGAAKPTAQLAAALGRQFSHALLKLVSPLDDAALLHAIEGLQKAGLLLALEDGSYQFRHALIQEAAYQSLPRGSRQAAHHRIAASLQADFPALLESQPEIIARHLTQAGEAAAALGLWLKAGQLAARRSANREAASHFEAGLALLPELADGAEKTRLEFALQAALGNLQIIMQGYGSEQARHSFSRAVALSRQVGEDAGSFPVIFGLWLGGRSEHITAAPLEFVERLECIANASGDPAHRMVVDYAYGNNLFWLGRHDEARRHQENALRAPAAVRSEHLVARYGEDTRILSRSFLAWTHWFQGRPDQARTHMARAVADARQLNHAHSLGFALTFSAVLNRHLGYPGETERVSRELARLAEDHSLSLWSAAATTFIGWAHAAQGKEEGLQAIRSGVEAARVAMRLVEATFRSFLVDALVRLGHYAEALTNVEETIALAESYDDVYLLPELLRLQATILLNLHPERPEQAESLLRRAIATAHRQGALILELRAATDLLLLPRNRHAAAPRELLQGIFARCDEGFDTPDLRRAAALLQDTAAAAPLVMKL